MPRRATPWWRAARHMFYGTVAGRQVPLNVTDPADLAAAWEALRTLQRLAAEDASTAPRTVAHLVTAFLADVRSRVKPRTFKGYSWYAGLFKARLGSRAIADLAAAVLEADARVSGWSSSTRNNYLSTAVTVLTWGGVKLDRAVKKPRKESAGMKSLIAEDTYRRMLTITRGDWRGIVEFLWETGARPSEAAAVELPFVSFAGGVVVLQDHKTAESTGADRLIYLTDAAAAVLRRQADRYGAGLLFRSQRGGPLSAQAFVMKFRRLSANLGVRVTAYGFRHSFACRALDSGLTDSEVAELLGQSGTAMLHKHYKHKTALGRSLSRAVRRVGQPPA
jgi:integrase